MIMEFGYTLRWPVIEELQYVIIKKQLKTVDRFLINVLFDWILAGAMN